MAGTFTAQNKIRPGAYIVFKAVAQNQITTGNRGTVLLPLELSWGEPSKLIDISASDYTQGNAFKLLGITIGTENAVPLRETFKNASLVKAYKLNSNAEKATGTLQTDISLTAAQGGELGNDIAVSSSTLNEGFALTTTVNGTIVDIQNLTTLGQYIPNGWVEIDGDSSTVLGNIAGVKLSGGTNGTVTSADFTNCFNLASSEIWNVLAVPTLKEDIPPLVTAYIQDLRENYGKKVQAVVYNYDANYEGIISVDQGYKIGTEEISAENFVCFVAGATAGTQIAQSNTYKVIEGATEIINPKSSADIETALQTGKMVISRRSDRAIVIEKDINTLHSFTADKSYVFSKNRAIRTLDDIATNITTVFETSYIGRVNNDASGRALFKGDIVGYLNQLQASGAIEEFNSATDIEVLSGNDVESIVVNLAIKIVDAMEKLYMTVVVS